MNNDRCHHGTAPDSRPRFRPKTRFASDSPLEGDEFELMVPGLRDRQTLMGDGTAVVKTAADLSGNRRFESVSLQRRVRSEPRSDR
jgi:hypothetical protein